MMKKILSITAITLLSVFALKSQTPYFWLRADSIENEHGQNIWRDISGNNNHGKLANCTGEILTEDLNFNPAILLTDSMQIKLDSIATDSGNITVMLVYQVSDSLREENVWQICDTSAGLRSGQTTQQIIDRYGGTRFSFSNSRQAVVSTQTQKLREASSAYSLNLGTFDTLPFCGKIAEVLFFSGIEHDSITKIWEAYLAIKYGITLYGRSYYNSAQDSIWNYFGNEMLSEQIIGTGKDEYFGLNQRQSITPDGRITFGCTSALHDSTGVAFGGNITEIENLQFIVLGIDTIAFKEKTEIYLENGFTLSKYGDFRIQKTGTQAIPTFMEISYSDFDMDTSNLAYLHLLINREGEEYGESVDFYPPESIDTAKKVLKFKNIYWDTDNSGSDMFCISMLTPDSTMNYAMLNDDVPGEGLLSYLESIYENSSSTDAASDLPKCTGCRTGEDIFSNTSGKSRISDSIINPCVAIAYPNPSTDGHFEVDIRFPEKTDATISIINQEGKVMETRDIKNIRESKEHFYIKAKGEYHILLQTETHEQPVKIIII
jgi:hypothetical protein